MKPAKASSFLSAWAGFFNSPEYLGRHYRISSVRYYGNGKEEGDFNYAGPNVETDGFGSTSGDRESIYAL